MRDVVVTPLVQELQGTNKQAEVPPPFGGLNTRDSRAAMPISDAVSFTNMIADVGGVKSRRGYEDFADGMTGTINFISDFSKGATREMIIGAGTILYKTGVGGGTATELDTGFTNSRWESAQLSGSMVLVNGDDTPQIYNGTTLTAGSYTGDVAALSGGASNMDGISTHKSRMYMWDSNTGDFYYGATNAIQGDFTKFDLSQISRTGGNLYAMETITRDGGDGSDDLAAFILHTGEVLIYDGSDPGTASNWALVGRYIIPAPASKRCTSSFAGDVLILTQIDVVSLTSVMASGGEGQGFNLQPTKLSGAINTNFSLYGSNYGWQLTTYGKRGWYVVNIPQTTDSVYTQYGTVLTTGSSFNFTNWNASVFGVFNDGLYFSVGNEVKKADSGFSDGGNDIQCRAVQAFSAFGVPNVKNVKDLTVRYLYDGTSPIGAEVAYDYADRDVTNQATAPVEGAQWDVALWDVALWTGTIKSKNIIFTVTGEGTTVSTVLEFAANGAQLTWLGTGVSFQIQTLI